MWIKNIVIGYYIDWHINTSVRKQGIIILPLINVVICYTK